MRSGLSVYWKNLLVGIIDVDDDGQMRFAYEPSWIQGPQAFPLSASLPLSGGWTPGREDHRWFANLLPEGGARESLCRNLGVSIENDAALLERIGADCAGAIRVIGSDNFSGAEGYKPVSTEFLSTMMKSRIPYRRAAEEGLIRLSLAGAQDKWPVKWDGVSFSVPSGGAPSTHIVKFPSREFTGLALNEVFSNALARCCGLPVPELEVYGSWLLVTRYDRQESEDGTMERIHQEDFCQALGVSSRLKYQDDGGPGLPEIAALIRTQHQRPAIDLLNLLRWQIFNILLGNSDGHAKNLSRLAGPSRGSLAPFYDLVCTTIYPGLSKRLALSVGTQSDPGQIRKSDWDDMAIGMKLKSSLIYREIDKLTGTLTESLDDVAHHISVDSESAKQNILDRISGVVKERIRRTQTLLSDK
jgi:serine/threonine-protein kinase HipA